MNKIYSSPSLPDLAYLSVVHKHDNEKFNKGLLAEKQINDMGSLSCKCFLSGFLFIIHNIGSLLFYFHPWSKTLCLTQRYFSYAFFASSAVHLADIGLSIYKIKNMKKHLQGLSEWEQYAAANIYYTVTDLYIKKWGEKSLLVLPALNN